MVHFALPAKLLALAARRAPGVQASQAPEFPARNAAGSGAVGHVQVCLGGAWRDFAPEVDGVLRKALAKGERLARFEARGQVYECDLERMEQVNLSTRRVRAIRVVAPGTLRDGARERPHSAGRRACSARAAAAVRLAAPPPPRWLHVWVPSGPTFVSGAYRLDGGQEHNGQPVWQKAVVAGARPESTSCCIFSTSQGHWAIGSKDDAGSLDHGLAWVHSPVRHRGLTPESMPRSWQHNHGGWTTDGGIIITEVSDASGLPWAEGPVFDGAEKPSCTPLRCGAAAGGILAAGVACAFAGDELFGDGHITDWAMTSGVAVGDFIDSLF